MKRKPWEDLDKGTADPSQWEEYPNIVGTLIHNKKRICWDDCDTGRGNGLKLDYKYTLVDTGLFTWDPQITIRTIGDTGELARFPQKPTAKNWPMN